MVDSQLSLQKYAAEQLIKQQRFPEAQAAFEKICEKWPGDGESWFMLSAIHAQQRQFEATITCSRRVLSLRPDFPPAWNNLGRALFVLGHCLEALEWLGKVAKRQPMDSETINNLGATLSCLGRMDEAIPLFERALEINPIYVEALLNLARCCSSSEAIRHYRHVLKLESGNESAIAGIALHYERLGEYDQAMNVLESALLAPDEKVAPPILVAYASICRHFEHCEQAIERLSSVLEQRAESFTNETRIRAEFSLGKLLDAHGDYDEAFTHYVVANNRKPHKIFNHEEARRYTDKLINVFSREYIIDSTCASSAVESPIFIVGMPRSGTSLVEQILCSHSLIEGVGESTEIGCAANSLQVGPNEKGFPECMLNIDQDKLMQSAAHYLDTVGHQCSEGVRRITDKMPVNYQYLGLINLMFPKARIIHCRRDARDTCLSIYFQNFREPYDYAYDLTPLGQTYLEYERLMAHWHAVLNMPMLEVDYEDLVAQPESEMQELIQFCGLEWEKECLNFHRSSRAVSTASYDQVRQPLYATSAGRWRNYETRISELLDVLGV